MIQGPCGDGKANLSCLPQSWCPALPFPTQNHSERFETEQKHNGRPGSGGSIHWTQRTRETGAGSGEMVYCKCRSRYNWLAALLAVILKLFLQWTCTLMQERIKHHTQIPSMKITIWIEKQNAATLMTAEDWQETDLTSSYSSFTCRRLSGWMMSDNSDSGWCFYNHNTNWFLQYKW